MTISTKAELKTALGKWLAREGDSNISGNADDFVTLAEARLNRVLPGREAWNDTTLTGTIGSRALALPSGFVEPVRLQLTTFGDYQDLSPRAIASLPTSAVNGTPSTWAINGASIHLDCPCDQAHTFAFRYRGSLGLSADADTNWLLTDHPDVYLFAVLVEAGKFSRNASWLPTAAQSLQQSIEEVSWLESRGDALARLTVDPGLFGRGGFNINEG